ncbi:ModD protein [Breoghania sp.]|uniref:ModD protein n=1 Tax=Breoghania sp. TaxID=2065378 RepID=UPI00263826C2|nr:ModD protein [Breoghania sp.]MDJ0932461.1 ModD protein [Breoghania sp.]
MLTLTDEQLDALLAQDVPCGDLTTEVLDIGEIPARMSLRARDPMVLSSAEEAARLVELSGGTILMKLTSGTRLEAGQVFLEVEGPAAALHRAWKVAQTLVEYSAGIATRADHLVKAARSTNPTIAVACTRKNFPGTKEISIKAVMAGGASIHRLGLSETFLAFANHRRLLKEPVEQWVACAKAQIPEKKVAVETDNVKDAEALARAGAEVLQLDKMPVADVAEVVALVKRLGFSCLVAATAGSTRTMPQTMPPRAVRC